MNTGHLPSKKTADETARTPIKGTVRRQAGQSTRERWNDYLYDEAVLAALPFGFMIWWLLIELLHRHSKQPTSLWLIGFLILLSAVNYVWRLWRIRHRAKLMWQGLDGEKYVAQIIERDLIPQGYRVFHDLLFEKGKRKFNIDHLLIGPNGIFCIETKTWSKPMKGETVATFDGNYIYLNGKVRQREAVGQACALANEASAFIKGLTGLAINVVPVVVVVGWYVRKTYAGIPKVLVVNEEALAVFVENVKGLLPPANIELIAQKIGEKNK